MMKRINISVLVILFSVSVMFSQDIINNELLNQVTNLQLINSNKSNIKDLKGSPYINPKFLPVKVDKIPGKKWSARYNAFRDEIEIKKENSSSNFVLNKKSKFSKIEFISSKIILQPYNYIENGKNIRGYLSQLNHGGPSLLLKKQSITFIDAKPPKTGYDTGKPAQFKKTKDKYFFKIDINTSPVELPKSKKDLAKLFPKQEKAVLSFIKKQGISTKKETDLIKLFNYINTLN